MPTSTFDQSHYVNWSLLNPRPCLYKINNDVIVFWNGQIMTYNMALSITAEILFNTPISYGISDQITEDYDRLDEFLQPNLSKKKRTGRELYMHVREIMRDHVTKLGQTLPNRKQALTWFNKEQCVNNTIQPAQEVSK
jgi:hypothetical protein